MLRGSCCAALLIGALLLPSACSIDAVEHMVGMSDEQLNAEYARDMAALVKKLHEPPQTGFRGDIREDERVQAAWKLGDRKVYSAIPDLAQALKDPNWRVRDNADEALVNMADHASSVQAELKDVALNDSSDWVRFDAAFALWDTKAAGPELLPVLTAICKDTNLVLATRAADLASAIKQDPTDYVPTLMRGMADPDVSERVIRIIDQELQYRVYLPVLLKGARTGDAEV